MQISKIFPGIRVARPTGISSVTNLITQTSFSYYANTNHWKEIVSMVVAWWSLNVKCNAVVVVIFERTKIVGTFDRTCNVVIESHGCII